MEAVEMMLLLARRRGVKVKMGVGVWGRGFPLLNSSGCKKESNKSTEMMNYKLPISHSSTNSIKNNPNRQKLRK